MSDLKITIDQLKNYLGTGLEVQVGTSGKRQLTALQDNSKYAFITAWSGSREKQMIGIEHLKPICYKLSDLDKHIPELGFVPIEELRGLGWADSQLSLIIRYAYTHITFEMAQQIMNWHFWLFGDEYFEKGLVIDKLKKDE